MKLSVIVPVYNASKYLEQCLNSIVNQTYRDLEILIINDGSTDNSLGICKNFANSDDRIKIFDIPNGGVSNARNLGLDNATGEYVAFVDSDDYLDLTMYEKLMNATINENTDGAVCHYYNDRDGELSKPSPNNSHIELGYAKKQIAEFTVAYSTYEYIPVYIMRAIYRRDIISQIRFDTSMSLGEDVIFLLNVITQIRNFSCVDEYLYYYRFPSNQKGESLSSTPNMDKMLLAAEKQIEFFKSIDKPIIANAVAFEHYSEIITRLIHNQLNIKSIDKGTKLKLKGLNNKLNYKAYINGNITRNRRVRAFLTHYKFHWLIKILLKLRKRI